MGITVQDIKKVGKVGKVGKVRKKVVMVEFNLWVSVR